MKKSRLFRRAVALVGVCIIVFLVIYYFTGDSFDRWVKKVDRPNYTLLFRQRTRSHYVAVFDAGGSQVAICSKSLKKSPGETSTSYAVFDMNNNDLHDFSAPDRSEELHRELRTPFFTLSELDGAMYPIREEYTGKIRVVMEFSEGPTGENWRKVIDEILTWHEESAR